MPIAKFQMPDGRVARFEVPDGTTPEQAQAAIQAQLSGAKPAAAPAPAPAKPFGQQLNDVIADTPRQLGLTARYGLEGLGGTFDALVGNPLRTLAAPVLGNKPSADTGGTLADLLHLPKPQTAQERVVGDATRMVAGGALPLAAGANMAKNGTGLAQGVGRMMAANPMQQLASAGAAGAAGGYTRETGGNNTSQLLASLAAGVAAPLAMSKAQSVATSVANRVRGNPLTPEQVARIDITIKNALEDGGMNVADVPREAMHQIRQDVAAAFRTSDQVSPDAVRRLADYRLTGLTPTAAGLTLDPAVVTQQKNLAKLGINSKDQVAQQLGRTQNANNRALINGLNEMGAGAAGDQIAGAGRVMDALESRNARAQDIIGSLYDRARDSAGRSAPLDHVTFTNQAGDLLHDANVESFLTPDIRNKLNGFATGDIPLTVEIAEQFKTGLGRLQRNATDGNVRHALGLVRQALDDTPLLGASEAAPAFGGNQLTVPGALGAATPQGGNVGQEAIDAFNKARSMNRSWMGIVERTPALQAVRDGVEPDKFVQQFIVGNGSKASVMDVAQLKSSIKASPDAMQAVREQILAHLKGKALNGAADEVGNFSQSAFNNALKGIGERKLALFFKPEEINQLKAIGRVASYEQFQPAGSAVNNSNTAGAAGAMLLDRIASSPLLSKLPFGQQAVAQPLQNIVLGIQAGNVLNVPRTLAVPGARAAAADQARRLSLGLSPALLMGAQSDDEERRKRSTSP